jgi:hypothetical protein
MQSGGLFNDHQNAWISDVDLHQCMDGQGKRILKSSVHFPFLLQRSTLVELRLVDGMPSSSMSNH